MPSASVEAQIKSPHVQNAVQRKYCTSELSFQAPNSFALFRRIGGQSHRLADGNQHAGEMDGSRHAAWSEEANNLRNWDLNDLH